VTGRWLEQPKREKIAGEAQLSKANPGNLLSGEELAKVSLPRPVRGSPVNEVSLHITEIPQNVLLSYCTTIAGFQPASS
jgi:hypothetical protein